MMKKLIFALLINFVGVSVHAQNKPLACQTDAVGGLLWQNGRWELSNFSQQRFILVQSNEGLTKESAAKALINDFPNLVSCKKDETVTCFDNFGGHLLFDPKTLKGGISILFGSISTKTKKDSVSVQVFTCTPF